MDNILEINFNTLDVEKFRIKLNGKEYKLTPVNNNEQEDAQSDIPTLSAFAEQLIRELKHQHRYRTAETYRCALNSFLRFLPEDDIALSKINRLLISDYEHFMKNKGIVRNSTSFYMRVLRTIYNKAIAYNYVLTKNHLIRSIQVSEKLRNVLFPSKKSFESTS